MISKPFVTSLSWGALFLGGTLTVVGCAPADPFYVTTLCEVRRQPERFDQRLISVHVAVESDGEIVVAIDPQCPLLGAAVKYSEVALESGDAEQVNSAIRESIFGTSARAISATLFGTFVVGQSPGQAATIVVDRVENLQSVEQLDSQNSSQAAASR